MDVLLSLCSFPFVFSGFDVCHEIYFSFLFKRINNDWAILVLLLDFRSLRFKLAVRSEAFKQILVAYRFRR